MAMCFFPEKNDELAVRLILSCEHANVHALQKGLGVISKRRGILGTQRTINMGASDLARHWQRHFNGELSDGEASRIIIDPNRSFSQGDEAYTRYGPESSDQRSELKRSFYEPYRRLIHQLVRVESRRGRIVLHVSVLSSSPTMGRGRDLGQVSLLYDPARPLERTLATVWQEELKSMRPHFNIRRNNSARSMNDGLALALRRSFSAEEYVGIELELCQSLLHSQSADHLAWLFHASLNRGLTRLKAGFLEALSI